MKKIGFWTALSLVIGNILGVGIFTTTGYLAESISNPWLILAAWLVGAIYALSGAKVYGYLASTMPERGGDYVYLKRHYNPYLSYLFGWAALFLTYTGSIAALGIGASHYLADIFPALPFEFSLISFETSFLRLEIDGLKLGASLLIIIFSFINYRGLITGGTTQIILTMIIFVFMLGYILIAGAGGAESIIDEEMTESVPFSSFVAGLAAVLFTYMGWTTVVYIANEVKEPARIIPRALVSGVIVVTLLYIGLNYVFLSAMPLNELKGDINVASTVARFLWGDHIGSLIALMILTAILSSLNSTILSGPHIYQAMAADGYLPKRVTEFHPQYKTPYVALWIQCGWSIILLMSGTFDQILTLVVAAILLFSILSGFVVIKIHSANLKKLALEKTVLSISVLIYLVLCTLVFSQILVRHPLESFFGFVLLSLSVPFYFFMKRQKSL